MAARRIVYSSEEEMELPKETSKKNLKWRDRPAVVLKYVDDNLQLNKINMETAPEGIQDGVRYNCLLYTSPSPRD